MIQELLLPFQFPFMHNAFLIMMLIAPAAAMLSCFLVLKGWSLMGDAVSHAVLPGVVLAYVVGAPLILGAFLAGLFCAVSTGVLANTSRVKQDTVMGVVFSGMFGLGIVLYTAIESDVHLDHILFGNMLGVGPEDLWTAGAISIAVAVILLATWRMVLAHAFDPMHARIAGLPVRVIHYGLLAMLSGMIVAMLSSVGLVLAIGMLIAPGAIAFLMTKKFSQMLIYSVLVALLSCISGIYLSFWIDSAPAPTIILIFSGVFVLCLVWRNRFGRVAA